MALLKCENLTLGYDGVEILSGLSFEIEKGDYLCIVGENGSGKTTLMKTILGLRAPREGSVTFGEGLKKTDVGYLPQQSDFQRDFPASVREIVLSGCQNRMGLRPFYGKKEKALALENIEKMRLSDLKARSYRELSGGQQQRVLLARALCAAREILLLDEPVAGLDPRVTEEMYSIIDELNKRDKMTIIMISHDIRAALRYSNKILHIGSEVFFGTTEEYLKSGEMNTLGGHGNG